MIEFFLHKIPGLSEHFIFATDDVFLGKPVRPDYFFDAKGNPIVVMGEKKWPDSYYESGFEAAAGAGVFIQSFANALKYAYDKTGKKFRYKFKHTFDPMRKSYLAETADADYDFFKKTTFTPFREKTKIQRSVFYFLDNARGRNTIRIRRAGDNKNIWFLRWNLWRMPATFCINGTHRLNSFARNLPAMKKLFPAKSGFEK